MYVQTYTLYKPTNIYMFHVIKKWTGVQLSTPDLKLNHKPNNTAKSLMCGEKKGNLSFLTNIYRAAAVFFSIWEK